MDLKQTVDKEQLVKNGVYQLYYRNSSEEGFNDLGYDYE
jgi:hypothetical protein